MDGFQGRSSFCKQFFFLYDVLWKKTLYLTHCLQKLDFNKRLEALSTDTGVSHGASTLSSYAALNHRNGCATTELLTVSCIIIDT